MNVKKGAAELYNYASDSVIGDIANVFVGNPAKASWNLLKDVSSGLSSFGKAARAPQDLANLNFVEGIKNLGHTYLSGKNLWDTALGAGSFIGTVIPPLATYYVGKKVKNSKLLKNLK
jgi:hypothetical protein